MSRHRRALRKSERKRSERGPALASIAGTRTMTNSPERLRVALSCAFSRLPAPRARMCARKTVNQKFPQPSATRNRAELAALREQLKINHLKGSP